VTPGALQSLQALAASRRNQRVPREFVTERVLYGELDFLPRKHGTRWLTRNAESESSRHLCFYACLSKVLRRATWLRARPESAPSHAPVGLTFRSSLTDPGKALFVSGLRRARG
jgi:hypothetical protein